MLVGLGVFTCWAWWRLRGRTALFAALVVVAFQGGGRLGAAEDDILIPRRVLDPLDQCPCWTGRAESLLLWRDAPQGNLFFESTGAGSGLNAADFTSGMAAGPRLTLFRHTGDLGAIEFNYFNVRSFTATEMLPATAGGYRWGPDLFCCAPLVGIDEVSGSMSSQLQSFEINRRVPTDGRVQWLGGFRWFQWNEGIGLAAITDLGDRYGFNTDTHNDLYGLQIGVDTILLRSGGSVWVEGLAKAGGYYNQAAQFTSFTNSFPPPDAISGGTSTTRMAFVGELGVTGVWQVNDWLALRTGWVAFWASGLALAPNQLPEQCLVCEDSPPTQSTNTGGSVFVNGLSIGLEARY